jgi:hypothetical protein
MQGYLVNEVLGIYLIIELMKLSASCVKDTTPPLVQVHCILGIHTWISQSWIALWFLNLCVALYCFMDIGEATIQLQYPIIGL